MNGEWRWRGQPPLSAAPRRAAPSNCANIVKTSKLPGQAHSELNAPRRHLWSCPAETGSGAARLAGDQRVASPGMLRGPSGTCPGTKRPRATRHAAFTSCVSRRGHFPTAPHSHGDHRCRGQVGTRKNAPHPPPAPPPSSSTPQPQQRASHLCPRGGSGPMRSSSPHLFIGCDPCNPWLTFDRAAFMRCGVALVIQNWPIPREGLINSAPSLPPLGLLHLDQRARTGQKGTEYSHISP